MNLSNDIMFKQIIKLEPIQAMRASLDPAIQCRTIVGAATIISGILGGSRALTIGGLIGSCIAEYMSSETSRPVPHILSYEITSEQRQTLVQHVREYLIRNDIRTLDEFIHSVTTRQTFMGVIIQIVMVFLSDIGYKCSVP